MKIFVHTHRIVKAKPLRAQELPIHEKIEVPAGVSFITPSNIDELQDGYYRMPLESDFGLGEQNCRNFWYVPKVYVDVFQYIAKVKTERLNFKGFPNPRDSNNLIKKRLVGTFVEIFDRNYINEILGIWECSRPICNADQQQIWSRDLQVS